METYYDSSNHKIAIAEYIVEKEDFALHEYTHRALLSSIIKEDAVQLSTTYQGIEAGLALYFPCSFNNRALFAPKIAQTSPERRDGWNLNQHKKFSKVRSSGIPDYIFEGYV